MLVPVMGVRGMRMGMDLGAMQVRVGMRPGRRHLMHMPVMAVIMIMAVVVVKRLVAMLMGMALQPQQGKSRQHERPGPQQPLRDRLAQNDNTKESSYKRIGTEESAGARSPQAAHGKYKKHQAGAIAESAHAQSANSRSGRRQRTISLIGQRGVYDTPGQPFYQP